MPGMAPRVGRAVPRLVPLSAPGRADLRPGHGGRRAAPRARRRRGADRALRRRARSRRRRAATASPPPTRRSQAGLDEVSAIDDDRILRAITRRGRRDAAHQRLRARRPRKRWRSSSTAHKVPGLPAPLPWREIWVYSPARRGHPPARRPGRARRPALVRPARRFPHRDPRADEGAARQERGDRADRRQGRLLSQAAAHRPRPTATRGWPKGPRATASSSARLLSITDNIVDGQGRPSRGRARSSTATIPISSSPPTRAPRRSATSPTRSRSSAASGWATPSPAAASVGYDHKAMGITAKGAWVSVQRHFAETRRRRADASRSASSAAATCRATCSATACCCRKTIKLVAAFDHRHIFLDPDPDPAASWDERDAHVRAAAVELGGLRSRR